MVSGVLQQALEKADQERQDISSSGDDDDDDKRYDGSAMTTNYGSISTDNEEKQHLLELEDISDDEEEDGTSDEDDDDDESAISQIPELSLSMKVWDKIKSCFLVVANVDNLWDDAERNDATSLIGSNGDNGSLLPSYRNPRRLWASKWRVLFWFVILAASYAGERSTFKLLVDRAGPFRLFAVQIVTGIHASLLGVSLLVQVYRCKSRNSRKSVLRLGIPVLDVGFMALMDSVSLVLVFLSGSHVPPTLTVILVQFTIPLTALLSHIIRNADKLLSCFRRFIRRLSFRDNHIEAWPGYGGLTGAHIWGSSITSLAVALALVPATICIFQPELFDYADTIPLRTAYNTFLYIASCLPAAMSQLYKESVFGKHAQAVPATYLNFLLSIGQWGICAVVAPLVYGVQGLGDARHSNPYPSSTFTQNLVDGLYCFFRILNDKDQLDKYSEDARCDYTLGLTIFHCISIIAVGVAVDKIVQAGATKVMYRGISAGIILAVVTMYVYDLHITEFNYGPIVDALNMSCLVLVILGTEVYHRESLPGLTFETTYPVAPALLYEDEQ